VFYFFFGWMMGRNIRATRQAAYNAALPESVKEERYAQREAQGHARAAGKEAKRQHRREFYNAHPRARLLEIVSVVGAVIAFLIYAFVFYSPQPHSVGTSIINAGTSPTPATTACAADEVVIESASATAPSPLKCVPVSTLTGDARSVADNQVGLCAPGHLVLTVFSDTRTGASCR
jgi:hypothetical protein